MGLLVVGIGALQFVLDKGQQEDWFASTMITTLAIISAVGLIALIVQQLMSKEPIIDLHLFTDRTYSVGVFLMTVLGFVLYGSLVLLPIMLQTLFGYPSLEAGEAMAPRGIGSLFMMPIVGMLTSKIDARKLLALGLFIGGITMIWLGQLNLEAGYWDIFWPQLLQGAGMALLFVPLTTVSMATIAPQRMGYATSLFNLMRNIGGGVGIAITGTMLARTRQSNSALLGEHVSAFDPDDDECPRATEGRIHGRRLGHRERDEPGVRRALRDDSAAGVDGGVREYLPPARFLVPRADSARDDHAPAERKCRAGRGGRIRSLGKARLLGCLGRVLPSYPAYPEPSDLRRRFDPQQRAVVFVGDDVEQSIRSLTHVANALMQLGEQGLAAQLFELVVHHHSLESSSARNLATPRAADEQVALPGRNLVARVEGEPGRRDRWDPQHERLLDAGPSGVSEMRGPS